jgi:hypothetical protein
VGLLIFLSSQGFHTGSKLEASGLANVCRQAGDRFVAPAALLLQALHHAPVQVAFDCLDELVDPQHLADREGVIYSL